MTERTIAACIDGSAYAAAACDAAVWAAARLSAPCTFVHVISRRKHAAAGDYSGQIGLGSREHLRDELAELDGARARLARERGADLLDSAARRAAAAGLDAPARIQRNGELLPALQHVEDDIRLLVIGKRGESAGDEAHLGSNLERVIRGMACPILITTPHFVPPQRVLIAYDGSATGQNLIQRAAATPLLSGVEAHLVYVGSAEQAERAALEEAADTLRGAGARVQTAVLSGDVEPALHAYQRDQNCDLMVMGAYGHTRIRHMLVGSTTTDMIRRAEVPVLITR
ncbi:universal stress protein [uncultured Salinisphaera sp.]|uniref:universal stress protein n=1 Tax=uncultured Salinisphaera sp. TaxID=359372 RepID=UPI0032B24D78|tara:strand:+ start:4195 stop:5049 length:855 start_codon:yes stop_codon:yes gene_type:complete